MRGFLNVAPVLETLENPTKLCSLGTAASLCQYLQTTCRLRNQQLMDSPNMTGGEAGREHI
jgi:hypothetical protein